MVSFNKILVCGSGFGMLYKSIFENVEVLDIDSRKSPDYTSVSQINSDFDLVIVATPNFTHYELCSDLQQFTGRINVEKPGFGSMDEFDHINDMVDLSISNNNVYRNLEYSEDPKLFSWDNIERVPHPGSWFTEKKKAFGGVSADLVPHLISVAMKQYPNIEISDVVKKQRWGLSTIKNTNYGEINPRGVYDVDDYCKVSMTQDVTLEANWSGNEDNIKFGEHENLGLCPEECYYKMLTQPIEFDHRKYQRLILEVING